MEDDIHVSPDLAAFLSDPVWIPADADILKLETSRDRVAIDRHAPSSYAGRMIPRLRSTHPGAAAYIISHDAARKLVDDNPPVDRPVDAFLFELPDGTAKDLVVYQVDPALCIQDDFLPRSKTASLASVVQDERRAVRRASRTPKQRLARLARQFISALWSRRKPSQQQRDSIVYKRIPFLGRISTEASQTLYE
jgi:glycosyl transferase family 25